ncbi:MAG: hypothetical protein CVU89_14070 [Firmicutes bacterium HGW-Firmicutes-14]|nr:MAG: hypothetical protein CVU89_14070 [Firmicutes bacterium HGW-Firmicutes-14]
MHELYTVTLTCSSSLSKGEMTLSEDILNRLKFIKGEEFTLRAGSSSVTVRLSGGSFSAALNKGHDPVLCISAETGQRLMLPAPLTINMAVEKKQKVIRLGPLIGILANRYENSGRPFGEQTSFFRKLRREAQTLHGFCYAFSPWDIRWENNTVRGSVPPLPDDKTTGWQTRVLPMPDVVYDRGLFPKGEKRQAATETRKILRRHPVIKIFNPAFFGKWKTHKLLAKHEDLYHHLPETKLVSSMSDIQAMLKRHAAIYLKPSGGSSGKGIICITSGTAGRTLRYRKAGKIITEKITGPGQLETTLRSLIGGRRYIVQQGLDLAGIDGSPFDIRVLMQKNLHGSWKLTGMAARVAAGGSFLSNIHAGGRAEQISSIIIRVFPQETQAQKVIGDIRRLSSLAVAFVSTEMNPLFGEIAVDLGIDKSGKVWFIELNAVPGRSVFRRIKALNALSRAISRPMEYACYLSGFGPGQGK